MKPYKKITLSTQRNSDISFGKSLDLFFTNCLAGTNNMLLQLGCMLPSKWHFTKFESLLTYGTKEKVQIYLLILTQICSGSRHCVQTTLKFIILLKFSIIIITIYYTSNSLCYKARQATLVLGIIWAHLSMNISSFTFSRDKITASFDRLYLELTCSNHPQLWLNSRDWIVWCWMKRWKEKHAVSKWFVTVGWSLAKYVVQYSKVHMENFCIVNF